MFFVILFVGKQMYVQAQQLHYIYIQTENKQAFYVKLNEKIFSSTGSGYVIVPQLPQGNYSLSIGFPKNEWPVQNIDINLNNADEGFILKNFAERGWGLFNLEKLTISMATATTPEVNSVQQPVDAFSDALAGVTGTAPVVKPGEVQTPVKEIKQSANINIPEKIQVQDTTIKQTFSDIDLTGRSMRYDVREGDSLFSITVFIPYNNNEALKIHEQNQQAIDSVTGYSNVQPVTTTIIQKDSLPRFVETTDSTKISSPGQVVSQTTSKENTGLANADSPAYTITILNPACKLYATKDDFTRLNRKMNKHLTDEQKVEEVKKLFKTKCFTTEQVKSLSALLQSDEYKYNLFDAAYKHVSDIEHFGDLQFVLQDEYYINRFKAILR
ncbi:MAG: DUF4476 domain-containing protein [Bacteroidetes bacterium]|nr:DUF4476 domain-containing protein [Bacteroidota bacterium]